ncbi:sulfatase-like hydrolase/transferase [bacterium]|nr:sulfatase-like hydrolase/transferase [bacterium]
MATTSRRHFLKTSSALFTTSFISQMAGAQSNHSQPPNIVTVFIDDMGWRDLSCFGNQEANTPNIDRMAREGIRFEQFYVNSPICSPSRVAISTGQYPQRHRITSYLAHRKKNEERGIANWLNPKAPMLARYLKQAGYATGHFGKWHMGGQRDVTNAVPITDYGFDASLTNFEGLGYKLLPLTEVPAKNGGVKRDKIWNNATILGDPVVWMQRSKITGGFVDRAMHFIDQARTEKKPFYINLWPDDVHSPFYPSVENWADTKRGKYLSVLEEMDKQFGPLFDKIQNDPALRENTLILICSDNGPDEGAGSSKPLKGIKATLFEGGVRSPLIAWGPGLIEKGRRGTVNESSIFSGMDLAPSLLHIVGVSAPSAVQFDGENVADTLLGKSSASRSAPLFFRRPPDRENFREYKSLPDLAVRDGKWKLLCDYGGENPQLYNLEDDLGEANNLAEKHPAVTKRLTQAILEWNATLPKDAGDPNYKP